MKDSDSIFYHYQKLIRLRKEYDVITDGDYEMISEDHESIFAFVRNTENEMLLVINNFYGEPTTYALPVTLNIDGYVKLCVTLKLSGLCSTWQRDTVTTIRVHCLSFEKIMGDFYDKQIPNYF